MKKRPTKATAVKAAAKTTTAKTTAPAAKAPVKAVEAKPAAKAIEAKPAPKAIEKKVETKPEAKKPAAKPVVKKPAAKKAPAKVMEPEVFVQHEGREILTTDIVEKVKAAYVAEGHRASAIKSLKVYIKPEDYAAYYVINDKATGKVML